MQISLKCSSWSNSQYSGIGLEKLLGDDRATSHYLNQWWLDHWHMYASHGLSELLSAYQKFPIIRTEPKWNIPYILDIWYNGVNGNNLPIVNSMLCKTSKDTKYSPGICVYIITRNQAKLVSMATWKRYHIHCVRIGFEIILPRVPFRAKHWWLSIKIKVNKWYTFYNVPLNFTVWYRHHSGIGTGLI